MTKLLATFIAWGMYQTNHILRFLANAFASSTLDRLSSQYSTWYNLELMSRLLNYSRTINGIQHDVRVTSQQTLDDLLIAELSHHHFSSSEIELYILNQLSTVYGINTDHVQITHLTPSSSKLVFPIHK